MILNRNGKITDYEQAIELDITSSCLKIQLI